MDRRGLDLLHQHALDRLREEHKDAMKRQEAESLKTKNDLEYQIQDMRGVLSGEQLSSHDAAMSRIRKLREDQASAAERDLEEREARTRALTEKYDNQIAQMAADFASQSE